MPSSRWSTTSPSSCTTSRPREPTRRNRQRRRLELASTPSAGSATPNLMDRPLRIDNTVRRARRENTAFVQRVLRRLEDEGAAWAPRALGIDELGREVVSWVPGATAASGDEIELRQLARMVRQLHDLTVELVHDGFECVVHDDLQPRNVVVLDRFPSGLIDWEQARPGRRVEDVAKMCWSFIEPTPESDPVEVGERWGQLAGVYGLEPVD